MAANTIHIAVVLDDGREIFDTMTWPPDFASYPEQKCQDALRKLGVTTSRKSPKQCHCKLFHLTYKNGQPHRQLLCECDVTPQLDRMTEDEFDKEMQEILSPLPKEFHGYVSGESWERGHSAGYEETASIAREMAHNLTSCVADYGKRMFEDGVKSVS